MPKLLRPLFQRHRGLLRRIATLAQKTITEALQLALKLPKGIPAFVLALHTFGAFSVEKITLESPTDTIIYRSKLNPKINRNFEVFDPVDFLAVLSQHIPDKNFQMVRYYGLYSNKMRGCARKASGADGGAPWPKSSPPPPAKLPSRKWRDLIRQAWGQAGGCRL